MRAGWPIAGRGQRIGLLGGSFDPPHAAHLAISRAALARFGLDRVWWLVSPGNPLKARAPAPLPARVAASRALLAGHPRILPTGIEACLGTRLTADTVAALRRLYPGVRFVWLMGADNMIQLHRWARWRTLAATVPMGVLARPGLRQAALQSPAAQSLRRSRLPQGAAATLPDRAPPAWVLASLPMSPLSSTAIRAAAATSAVGRSAPTASPRRPAPSPSRS